METGKIQINTDGGARGNPGPAASAFVVKNSAGVVQYRCGKFLGVATNNKAEYEAVIMALEWVRDNMQIENGQLKIDFFSDSSLMVNQIKGKFRVKNPELINLYGKIKNLIEEINGMVTFSFVPREQNVDADLLVNKTLDGIKISQIR